MSIITFLPWIDTTVPVREEYTTLTWPDHHDLYPIIGDMSDGDLSMSHAAMDQPSANIADRLVLPYQSAVLPYAIQPQ